MLTGTLKKLYTQFPKTDTLWRQRVRKIDTAAIFANPLRGFINSQSEFAALCSGSLNKRGLEYIVQEDGSNFTAQALGKARQKLPTNVFADINREIQTRTPERVFAIDGSKVHVHPSFVKYGCKSRTNGQKVSRPASDP